MAECAEAARRRESLATRQARVGIVANPNEVAIKPPVPRDVWARWPDLRSAKRRKAKEGAQHPAPDDAAAFDAFVRSVRRAAPAPDLAETVVQASRDVPAASDMAPRAPSRILLAGLVIGIAAVGVLWQVIRA